MIKITKLKNKIPVYDINVEDNHNFYANGILVHNCVESFSINSPANEWLTKGSGKTGLTTLETDGLTHSCSLVSVVLTNIFNDAQLKETCRTAVRCLDTSIDLGKMPVLEAENSSLYLRNTGIGTLGTADWMAYNKLSYEKAEDLDKLEALYEKMAYYCYEASIELAEEKGSYPWYEKANYDKLFGETPERLNEMSKAGLDWVDLVNRIKTKGIRNFLLLATAPNTSTGILCWATASYLPPQDKFNTQTLAEMVVPILPKYLKTRNWYYKSKFYYKPEDLIKVTAILQRWIDTGISMEVPMDLQTTNIKVVSDTILDLFFKNELKAVYYSLTVDTGDKGCTSCAN